MFNQKWLHELMRLQMEKFILHLPGGQDLWENSLAKLITIGDVLTSSSIIDYFLTKLDKSSLNKLLKG